LFGFKICTAFYVWKYKAFVWRIFVDKIPSNEAIILKVILSSRDKILSKVNLKDVS
jgi:hypothetical protein